MDEQGIHPLRLHRNSLRWTLDEVAEKLQRISLKVDGRSVGVDGLMVGRWERREQRPRSPYPKLLCILYGATPVELGLAPSPYRPPCDTLGEVERRRVLRLLTTACAAPVIARGAARAGTVNAGIDVDRLARVLEHPSKADRAVVSSVAASILAARRHDDVSGPRVAVHMALAQREVLRVLLEGGPSDPVRTQLMVAAAEVSQFLAWLAYDMNDEATCLAYLDEALKIAYETDAHSLAAYLLGHRSIVEAEAGRLQQGLAYAEAARSLGGVKGTSGLQSWLAGREAFVLARVGDRSGAERALERARKTFSRSRAGNEPSWLYYWDRACVEGMVGRVLVEIGDGKAARRLIQEGLSLADPSMIRDRADRLAWLGQTYVLDEEVDEACRLAGDALTIATLTRSDYAVLQVRELRAQLKPWESEAMVRELDDQLAATDTWCKSFVV